MKTLIDTNVLVRLLQPSNPSSVVGTLAIQHLLRANFLPCLVPQNLYELWAVATRPAERNGFGMSCEDTDALLQKCLLQFRLLRDERGIFDHWTTLVKAHSVQVKNAHDARLVAAMLKHSVPCILTFNGQDFSRFAIKILDPEKVAQGILSTNS
ncbi:MAG: PIN domain-containing protein [Pirellulaceae bacterium]|nr:PIN domain-containing protein [Pirellulaceae bacterium]